MAAVPICPDRNTGRLGRLNCTVNAPVAILARPSISVIVAVNGPSPADSIEISAAMPTRNFDASRSTMGTRNTKPSSAAPSISTGVPAAMIWPACTLRMSTTPLEGAYNCAVLRAKPACWTRASAPFTAASADSNRAFVTQPSAYSARTRSNSARTRSRSAVATLISAPTFVVSSAASNAPRFTKSPSSKRTSATFPAVVNPKGVSRR